MFQTTKGRISPSLIFSCYLILIAAGIEDGVINRNYMIQIIDWSITDSPDKVKVSHNIFSHGDGSRVPPNVTVLINVEQPLTKIFAKITLRISSNNCNLCHVVGDHTFDVCKLMNGAKLSRNLMRIYEDIDAFRIFPKKCPVKGEFNFYNVILSGRLLPQYIPNGLLNINILLSERRNMKRVFVKSNFTGKLRKI